MSGMIFTPFIYHTTGGYLGEDHGGTSKIKMKGDPRVTHVLDKGDQVFGKDKKKSLKTKRNPG
jgi:hypothetical protein